jgi:hypothetical protein
VFGLGLFHWLVPGIIQARPVPASAPRGVNSASASKPSWPEERDPFGGSVRWGSLSRKSGCPRSDAKRLRHDNLAQEPSDGSELPAWESLALLFAGAATANEGASATGWLAWARLGPPQEEGKG